MTKPEPLKNKINQFRDNYGNNHDNYFLENDVKAAVKWLKLNICSNFITKDILCKTYSNKEKDIFCSNCEQINIAFQDVIK